MDHIVGDARRQSTVVHLPLRHLLRRVRRADRDRQHNAAGAPLAEKDTTVAKYIPRNSPPTALVEHGWRDD